MSLFRGDYLRENEMMENNTEICSTVCEEFQEGVYSQFCGEEECQAILEMSHYLSHQNFFEYM